MKRGRPFRRNSTRPLPRKPRRAAAAPADQLQVRKPADVLMAAVQVNAEAKTTSSMPKWWTKRKPNYQFCQTAGRASCSLFGNSFPVASAAGFDSLTNQEQHDKNYGHEPQTSRRPGPR